MMARLLFDDFPSKKKRVPRTYYQGKPVKEEEKKDFSDIWAIGELITEELRLQNEPPGEVKTNFSHVDIAETSLENYKKTFRASIYIEEKKSPKVLKSFWVEKKEDGYVFTPSLENIYHIKKKVFHK